MWGARHCALNHPSASFITLFGGVWSQNKNPWPTSVTHHPLLYTFRAWFSWWIFFRTSCPGNLLQLWLIHTMLPLFTIGPFYTVILHSLCLLFIHLIYSYENCYNYENRYNYDIRYSFLISILEPFWKSLQLIKIATISLLSLFLAHSENC